VSSSRALSVFILLCNHSPEHFHLAKLKLYTHYTTLFPPFPARFKFSSIFKEHLFSYVFLFHVVSSLYLRALLYNMVGLVTNKIILVFAPLDVLCTLEKFVLCWLCLCSMGYSASILPQFGSSSTGSGRTFSQKMLFWVINAFSFHLRCHLHRSLFFLL
jgi:hypothetical protein